jgi:hypothetical protein
MSNSLANTPGVLIAKRLLATLLEEFPFLRAIATDFSDEPVVFNQPINVKLPTAFGAASDYSAGAGYAVSAANQIDVPLTINKHKHVTYGFSDTERASTTQSLIESFASNAAQALGLAMVNDLLALVVAANFTNNSVNLASAYNRARVVAMGKKLTARKVPKMGRFQIINSDYAETLSNDSVLVSNAGSPADTVRSGLIGNVHGFQTFEYAQIPTNSEALAGFAAIPEALILATRIPPPPDVSFPGTISTVSEPNTGLTIQLRQWYDPKAGMEYRTYTLMYGVAAGNPLALERLTLS